MKKRKPKRTAKKKAATKPKSARRAVNIKVNVLSKNPKKRKTRKPASRKRAKGTAKGRRFVICARSRGGKRFYETAKRRFIADRKQARIFATFTGASKEAHRMLPKMPATVKSVSVEAA